MKFKECALYESSDKWKATHKIIFTPKDNQKKQVTLVMLYDGVAYTKDEFDTGSQADWSYSKEDGWRWQGQSTPGGENGSVKIEKIG
jgi:hypothetical protein